MLLTCFQAAQLSRSKYNRKESQSPVTNGTFEMATGTTGTEFKTTNMSRYTWTYCMMYMALKEPVHNLHILNKIVWFKLINVQKSFRTYCFKIIVNFINIEIGISRHKREMLD